MRNHRDSYARPKDIVRRPRHERMAKLFLLALGVLAIYGLAHLIMDVVDVSPSPLEVEAVADSTTTIVEPRPTLEPGLTNHSTSTSITAMTSKPEPTTSTTGPTTTSTITSVPPTTPTPTTTSSTLPPLAMLEPVALERAKLVKVIVTWQGVRDPSQSYDVGADYIVAVNDSAAGPTAEGYIWAEIPQQAVTVVVNQTERRYELEVSQPPTLSYSLWSQNDCKLYSSVQPEVQVVSHCPGMSDIDGRIFDAWKRGVFYPWFSSSRCVSEDEVNAMKMAGLALRTSFARAHDIDVESVRLSELPAVENAELPFAMPTPSGLDGYELSVVWQACQDGRAG